MSLQKWSLGQGVSRQSGPYTCAQKEAPLAEESRGAARWVIHPAGTATPSRLTEKAPRAAETNAARKRLTQLSFLPVSDERAPADQCVPASGLEGNAGEALRALLVLHASAVRTFGTQLAFDVQTAELRVAVRIRVAEPLIGLQGPPCIEREHGNKFRLGCLWLRRRELPNGHEDQSHQRKWEENAAQHDHEPAPFHGFIIASWRPYWAPNVRSWKWILTSPACSFL